MKSETALVIRCFDGRRYFTAKGAAGHEVATAKESEIHPVTAKSCVPPAWRQPTDNGTYKVRYDVTE